MPRKAIDSRLPALIRNNVEEKKRSFIVVVGDRAKDVIVHLHYLLSSVNLKQNKSVLWAYKKDLLGFTSHRRKREAKIRKEVKRGIREANTEDPFELFVTLHNIRYVYYKETDKILGNTYGMCILQDFEAITPNLLARTIETVEGGGLVLLLLKGMKSLKQLYTLSMDVHSRYRTEAHDDVVARFNERFILSLGSCEACLVVDDELNVLPISGGKHVKPRASATGHDAEIRPINQALKEIKDGLADTQPIGSLVTLARTVDQAKALLTFVDAISEKTLRSTVTLTAARGRGKSAALGMAVAAAVAHGYSNIFITSPSPENLKTLFEFVFQAFDALKYVDHVDYTILQSTNPDFNKAVVRVNVHRQHRQTIQYIQPQDAHVLGQAELLVIDEAAAIPLPLVKKLMGPYLVFMASTINGYEGTGRSLSLKLIQQLREQSQKSAKPNDMDVADRAGGKNVQDSTRSLSRSRILREITLSEPIRYAPGDAVEQWLNNLLCLDATLPKSKLNVQGCPHPSECQLLHVNRDTLFSFHPVSEKFLHQMMALYVASHYKNSPNDLQLMSDAPAHQLFVLVPPISEEATRLPEPLCVIQVALEGRISRQSVLNSLSRGQRAGGDLIPWLVSQQFQDSDFAGLSGSRIVRIATNPEYLNMGYGSRALQMLTDFYEGKFTNLSEPTATNSDEQTRSVPRVTDAVLESASLLDDLVKVRDIHAMPPLFSKLSERSPDSLDYLGVSFGLTPSLHKFWKRSRFAPVYLRQTPNELTGEHSCVMLRSLKDDTSTKEESWLSAYCADFHKRFLTLLSYQFRAFSSIQSLSISESAKAHGGNSSDLERSLSLTAKELESTFSPFDLARLESYANNMLDYHVILDLLPQIAMFYFTGRMVSSVSLSGVQQAVLLAMGLQRKALGDVEKELGLPSSQLLAMFVKVVRKVASFFRRLKEGALGETLPAADAGTVLQTDASENTRVQEGMRQSETVKSVRRYDPLAQSLPEDLAEGSEQVDRDLKEKQRALIDALPLEEYEINKSSVKVSSHATGDPIDEQAWQDAERQIRAATAADNKPNGSVDVGLSTTVSVKSAPNSLGKRDRKDGADTVAQVNGNRNDGSDGEGVTQEKKWKQAKKRKKEGHEKRDKKRKKQK